MPPLLSLIVAGILFAFSPVRDVLAQPPPTPPAPGTQPGAGGPPGPGRGGFGRGFPLPPGPPAPVPPEVTFARPSSEELTAMNQELRQFLNTSKHKDLFQKYAANLSVPAPRDNPCIRPQGNPQNPRHLAFMEIANKGDFDVMFLGDSITDLLNVTADPQGNSGGKSVVEKYLSDVKIANFGISGDSTQGVLWRLQNGEGKAHKPKAVMVMIGTNNMNPQTSGAEVAEGIGAITLELRNDFPDAKILLVAIFPRGPGPNDANRKKIEEANGIIARLDDQKHVFFLNLNEKFLDPQGGLIGFRSSDNLHPVEQGFDIWISAVAPILKSWIK
jgi:lysophospholipase L1-like esterase